MRTMFGIFPLAGRVLCNLTKKAAMPPGHDNYFGTALDLFRKKCYNINISSLSKTFKNSA